MPGPHRKHLRINDNEIESQKSTEEPQGQREPRHSLQVWQHLFVRARTLQLLVMQLQVTALLYRCHVMAALANARAALITCLSISFD